MPVQVETVADSGTTQEPRDTAKSEHTKFPFESIWLQDGTDCLDGHLVVIESAISVDLVEGSGFKDFTIGSGEVNGSR